MELVKLIVIAEKLKKFNFHTSNITTTTTITTRSNTTELFTFFSLFRFYILPLLN